MVDHFFLPRSVRSIMDCNIFKMFTGPIWIFAFSFFCIFFMSIAEANDFNSVFHDLGNKSRSKIKTAVQKLGELGNPSALPALIALKNKRLAVTDEGKLIILNDSESQGVDALTGERRDIKPLTLRKPRINNSVRRYLSAAIAKLKMNSEEPAARLEAAQELLKRPSSSVLGLVESSLKKEKNGDVKEILLLVQAKINLQSEDNDKRIKAISIIKEFGNNDFFC
ncbi:uncharacterized protein METZ01_LOCUS426045, partial [marine metagenome]